MECMRAFIEKDRHVEGCWTSYSSSLERPVLKKLRYLDDQPAPVTKDDIVRAAAATGDSVAKPAPAAPVSRPPAPAAAAQPSLRPQAFGPGPAQPGGSGTPPPQRPLVPGQPVTTAAGMPQAPRRPMAPAQPAAAPRHTQQPGIPSLFGEKLAGALQDDKENS